MRTDDDSRDFERWERTDVHDSDGDDSAGAPACERNNFLLNDKNAISFHSMLSSSTGDFTFLVAHGQTWFPSIHTRPGHKPLFLLSLIFPRMLHYQSLLCNCSFLHVSLDIIGIPLHIIQSESISSFDNNSNNNNNQRKIIIYDGK